MATFYINLETGSDAAAGTSWGTAWRTFANGPTAARIAPGDEIRVAKSPDPTSLGTATWTNEKIGNSITFSSAPTQQIDRCKAGWVTMGAGSVVTNAQTTAYMTPITYGATPVGALQWVTTASANGAYKDLGSTIDFSGNQQVCFWFRSGTALDCTGSQNLLVDLCSDAAATVVVTALTAPKFNYNINQWYPIVINFGSALSSTVRSVRIRTTNTTSQTFYIDEMFASPAGGLTLWSLIAYNNTTGPWYPIRACNGADVCLLGGFTPANAAAAGIIHTCDSSWMGTTQTVTTYKRETIKTWVAAGVTTGPGVYFGITLNEPGTAALPNRYLGGWNTGTNLQDGLTLIDNVVYIASSLGLNLGANGFTRLDKFGLLGFAGHSASAKVALTDFYFIRTISPSLGSANSPDRIFLTNAGVTAYSFNLCGTSGAFSIDFTNANAWPVTVGECWGISGTFTLGNIRGSELTVGSLYAAPVTGTNMLVLTTISDIRGNFADLKVCRSATVPGSGWLAINSLTCENSQVRFNDIGGTTVSASANSIAGRNTTYFINSYSGNAALTSNAGECTILVNSYNGVSVPIVPTSTAPFNSKVYLHNFNGTNGYFRAYVADITSVAVPSYFDLDAIDVYTPGSRAVRLVGGTYITLDQLGSRLDLKLGSAAAEANKLVTVTCRVKRGNTSSDTGIYIPGFGKFLPGYTTDQSVSSTTTGTWELLTVTFTPTADCVFDVMAWYRPIAAGTPTCAWDTLSITQAP